MNEAIGADQAAVVKAEARPPREGIAGWFGALREACKKDPRIVLRALASPDKLAKVTDEMSVQAEALQWELGGREKTRKKFSERGLDADKAIGVIDFLRANVGSQEYPKDKDGSRDYDHPFQRNYHYEEGDFALIERLMRIDDSVGLLEELGNVVNYKRLNHVFIGNLVKYVEVLGQSDRTRKVLSVLEDFSGIGKLDVGYGCLVVNEGGERKTITYDRGSKGRSKDPIQVILDLSEEEYGVLLSEENVARATDLWAEIGDGKDLPVMLLPDLLRVCLNQRLTVGLREMVHRSRPLRENFLGYFPEQFGQAVIRLQKMSEAVPEMWDLYEDGFDVGWGFDFPEFSDSPENIDQFVQFHRADFQAAAGNELLRTNARILKKHGLSMSLRPHDRDFYDYVRTSDSDRLEKSLIVWETAGEIVHDSYSERDGGDGLNRFWMWESLGSKLDSLSTEEVKDAFSAFSEVTQEDLGYVVGVSALTREVQSVDELKQRIQTVLNPAVGIMVRDNDFMNSVFNSPLTDYYRNYWDEIIKRPNEYLELYKDRELLMQRLILFQSDGHSLSVEKNTDTLKSIVNSPIDDIVRMRDEMDYYHVGVTKENIEKFVTSKVLTIEQKQQIVEGLRVAGVKIDSIYDSRLISADLHVYLGLDEATREEVWKVKKDLESIYFRVEQGGGSSNQIILGFLCDLAVNPALKERLVAFSHFRGANGDESAEDWRVVFRKNVMFVDLVEQHRGDSGFNIDTYIDLDGDPTSQFLHLLASAEGQQKYEDVDFLLTDQVLEKMTEKDKKFWSFWKKHSSDSLHTFMLDRIDEFDLYVNGDGLPTEAMLNKLVSSRKSEDYIAASILLSDELCASLGDESSNFWNFWKKHNSDLIHTFFLEHRNEVNQLVVEGKPTQLLLGQLARDGIDDLTALLTDENLANLPQSDREYWGNYSSLTVQGRRLFNGFLTESNGIPSQELVTRVKRLMPYLSAKMNFPGSTIIASNLQEFELLFNEKTQLISDDSVLKFLLKKNGFGDAANYMGGWSREQWKEYLGETNFRALLDCLPARTDESRNAFLHNQYDRTTELISFLIRGSGADFLAITPDNFAEVVGDYVRQFGMAKSVLLFHYFSSLKLKELDQNIEMPMDVLESGISSTQELLERLNRLEQLVFADEPLLPEDLQKMTDFEKGLLVTITGKDRHRFDSDRPSFASILERFESQYVANEISPLAAGYRPEGAVLQKREIVFDAEKVAADFKQLRDEIVAGIDSPNDVSDVVTDYGAYLDKRVEEVQKTLATIPVEKRQFVLKELDRISQLRTQLGEITNVEELLSQLIQNPFGKGDKQVYQAFVRRLLFKKLFQKHSSPHFIENMRHSLGSDQVEVQSLLSVLNVVDEMVKVHLLNLDSNNQEEYWSEDIFQQLCDKKTRDDFDGLFTNAGRIRKEVNQFQEVMQDGSVDMRFIPDRGLIGEMAGYLADVCYTKEYPLLPGWPVVPYKFVTVENGVRKFIGSVLVFEVKDAEDNLCLLIRAFDVPDESNYPIGDMIESFIGKLELVAAERKASRIIAAGTSGTISNYQMTTNHFLSRYKTPETLVPLKDRFAFNGYDITNECYLVRDTNVAANGIDV